MLIPDEIVQRCIVALRTASATARNHDDQFECRDLVYQLTVAIPEAQKSEAAAVDAAGAALKSAVADMTAIVATAKRGKKAAAETEPPKGE